MCCAVMYNIKCLQWYIQIMTQLFMLFIPILHFWCRKPHQHVHPCKIIWQVLHLLLINPFLNITALVWITRCVKLLLLGYICIVILFLRVYCLNYRDSFTHNMLALGSYFLFTNKSYWIQYNRNIPKGVYIPSSLNGF